jgi:succinyl-diaminopimelate desuccinylase
VRQDRQGVTMEDALRAYGLDPAAVARAARRRSDILAYVELHIEQGPVLERQGLPVGIVTSINGVTRLEITVSGRAGHAGTVPMDARQDALAAAAECILAVEARCRAEPGLVGTVGVVQARPGAINVIPGQALFAIDLRTGDDARRRSAVDDILASIADIAARRGVTHRSHLVHELAAAPCAPWLLSQIERAVVAEAITPFRLSSGAGHDGMAITPIADIGMIFVRCAGGISHHPDESITAADAEAARAALCRAVDERHAAQRDFLAELVRVPSDNPPGDCAGPAARAAELLRGLGFAVETHPVPDATVRANGMVSVTNLVVRHRFGPGPVVGLNAHGDVVPPGDGWTVDPYGAAVIDGVMYGRGVAVSKSDFATYAFALRALIETGAARGGAVELHFTYDEEAGGLLGPGFLLEQGIVKPDYMICAGFSYNVVVAHNGCLHLEVSIRGRSAHAAQPESGADALEAATALLASLYALRDGLSSIRSGTPGIAHPTLVVGLIKGGINTNVVPDLVTLRLDRRIIPEENPASVERALVRHIEQICGAMPGIAVTVRRILLAAPLEPQPTQAKLIRCLQTQARAVLGEDIPAVGVPLYTDARHYAGAGIPTVLYGAGPRSLLEANGHRADEKLVLEDLRKATQIVALAVADLLSG